MAAVYAQNISIFTSILLYIDYLLYQILNKTVYSTVESVLLVCLKNTNKTNKLIVKKCYNVTE